MSAPDLTPPPVPNWVAETPAPPPAPVEVDPAQLLATLPAKMGEVMASLQGVIVGQQSTVEAMMYALLSRGHCLLVGVPGLGKTLLVNALSRVLGLPSARVQFTPDLMPADITGSEILEEDVATGKREFKFVRGPVFTNILLADEINRTPPKTQAALLEAMQEKTVTIAGKHYVLDEPFLVLATQNPIEQEGTYPLPEAQLDRFLFELPVRYPTLEEERLIVSQHQFTPLNELREVLDRATVIALRSAIAQVPAAPNVVDYAVRLVRATRPEEAGALESIRPWVRWGASPRASQNLIIAGRARAACQGRFHVSCEDVAALAPLVLRHRIIRNFQAEADGQGADEIVEKLLAEVPAKVD